MPIVFSKNSGLNDGLWKDIDRTLMAVMQDTDNEKNKDDDLVKALYSVKKSSKFGERTSGLTELSNFAIVGEGEVAPLDDIQEDLPNLADWQILDKYDKLNNISIQDPQATLKEYDDTILNNLSYPIIWDWVQEGITVDVLRHNKIGYYPTAEQITIPHYDMNGRFIGLRGRALSDEDAEIYGKYRPLVVGKQMYNHPLGLNLYNLNNSIENIKKIRKAIIFEGEKSCLLYQSYFGISSDISVACCGSSISSVQMALLIANGVEEVIVAFDRQFKEKNDEEFKHQIKNYKALNHKYRQFVQISFMFDNDDILPYKASPIDCGPEIFLKLFKERVML